MPTDPNTAEPGKLRRRWFQFRLRTLLIGMALFGIACSYVTHEATIVAERKAWYKAHSQQGYIFDVIRLPEDEVQPPSLIRRWLGDESYSDLAIQSEDDRRLAEELFPEAAIYTIPR